jgi:hypothetical protein
MAICGASFSDITVAASRLLKKELYDALGLKQMVALYGHGWIPQMLGLKPGIRAIQ